MSSIYSYLPFLPLPHKSIIILNMSNKIQIRIIFAPLKVLMFGYNALIDYITRNDYHIFNIKKIGQEKQLFNLFD